MALLLSAHRLKKTFGARQLFGGISFGLESGDRVGLIGPNGAGKSTLLRCLAREETADDGDVTTARGLRIGYLRQTPDFEPGQTIYEALAGAGDRLDPLHLARVEEWISRLELNGSGRRPETQVETLSGGWQKRVALARELVRLPDLLLLDEPTNHLDVEGILWLEDFLATSEIALLMVTHDRLFLERTVNRILDLDPRYKDGLLDIRGGYADYLEARELQLAAQNRHEETMRNRLRRETEWLRRGAKARQTKQKARIERALELGDATAELSSRNQERRTRIEFQDTERRPQKLIEACGIGATRGDRLLFESLDLVITPKTRLALLGANGSGKSTLIRTLLKRELPDTGSVLHADQVRIAWFEQDKQSLDPELPVLRAVCPEGDYVHFQGRPVYARAYLSRFIFRSEQMDMPIRKLSGGEKSRLRVAQLMLQPANVLILDEPTNDLDASTLDVLSDSLNEFDGAVILVTHDRYFLDEVCDRILAFPVRDEITDRRLLTFSGYEQWEAWHDQTMKQISSSPAVNAGDKTTASKPAVKKRKLSFNEKREWETMEAVILEKEVELERLQTEAATPEAASDAKRAHDLFARIGALQSDIERLYARWAELEALVGS